jgi:ribosomal 50S subunit-recycling heat shock protein
MRIDKYLKVARIIKRRTIANEACDADRIVVNGRVVKASYEVKIGDIIEVTLGGRKIKVQVVLITETTGKASASDLYNVIE